MSRTGPWAPAAISPFPPPAAPVELKVEQTERIGAILGAPLDEADRASLADICDRYLALRQAELNPPADDWEARIAAVEQAALVLEGALQAFLGDDWASDRFRRLIDAELRAIGAWRRQQIALRLLTADVGLLREAAADLRARLREPGLLNGPDGEPLREIETSKSTFALDYLVEALERFAERFEVAATTRNDENKATPFLELIAEVQETFPVECRVTSQSHPVWRTLSKAVQRSKQRRAKRDR